MKKFSKSERLLTDRQGAEQSEISTVLSCCAFDKASELCNLPLCRASHVPTKEPTTPSSEIFSQLKRSKQTKLKLECFNFFLNLHVFFVDILSNLTTSIMSERGMNHFYKTVLYFVRSLRPSFIKSQYGSVLIGKDHLGNKYYEIPASKYDL